MQLDPRASVDGILMLRLRDREQILEHVRVTFELSSVYFECRMVSHKHDISIREPEVRSSQFFQFP